MLAWAAWPVLPLALWALWLERRKPFQARNFLMSGPPPSGPCCCFSPIRPSRPRCCRPGAAHPAGRRRAARLRRGAANAFDWFGMMTFTLVAGLIWLGGIAMLTGEPARVAKNFSKPAPGFVAEAHPLVILLAIAASVAWIAVMLRTPRSPWRAAARWSVGVTTIWVLLMLLWLPWIDHGKTYRSVSADSAPCAGQPIPAASRGAASAWRSAPRSIISMAFARWAAAVPGLPPHDRAGIAARGQGHPGLDPLSRTPRAPATRASGCGCIAAPSNYSLMKCSR
jgi:4-amino-4-deoxy-L-arabinose transferase-like glycosyltransferase